MAATRSGKFNGISTLLGHTVPPRDTPPFPPWVHIENTNACPARCVMCPMDTMERKTGLMDFGLYLRLIRECAAHPEVEQVHLHGFGEPLLDKTLPQKVALAKELGIRHTYFVTTGSLLTETMARELILAGLDDIKFSFYGMSKPSYEAIHRRLDFTKTVRNIETFFRVRDELKAANPAVRFQFSPGLAPAEEFDQFLAHWRPYMDRDRRDRFVTTGLHNWAGGKDYAELRLAESERHCKWPFTDIQILWNGAVVPCVYDYDGSQILGDVNESSIEEIWRSERYEAFRQIWRDRRSFSIAICSKCDEPDALFQPQAIDKSLQPARRGIIGPHTRLRRKTYARIKRFFQRPRRDNPPQS
jgi:radical SAM protein with 4Fe4S-binding SPASM domain